MNDLTETRDAIAPEDLTAEVIFRTATGLGFKFKNMVFLDFEYRRCCGKGAAVLCLNPDLSTEEEADDWLESLDGSYTWVLDGIEDAFEGFTIYRRNPDYLRGREIGREIKRLAGLR